MAALSFACEGRRAAQTIVVRPPQEEDFTTGESPSLQFLPRQEEAPGWRLESDPVVVPGNKLASYLDGEASIFISYGAVDLAAGNYLTTGGNGFATVEIFRFPDFVKAFGAYSVHKKGPRQFINIENEAFASKNSIQLWRGPFYVRIVGSGGTEGPAAMQRLLTAVIAHMPAAPARPAVFNFLPTADRVPNSERYSVDSGFGQPFLGNSFQADFTTANGPVTGLVIPAADKNAAAAMLAAYRMLYVRNGKLLDPIPNLGEENFSAEDKFLGRAVAFRIDRFLIAFNGYTDRQTIVNLADATDQRILGTIRKQLVTTDNIDNSAAASGNLPGWAQRKP